MATKPRNVSSLRVKSIAIMSKGTSDNFFFAFSIPAHPVGDVVIMLLYPSKAMPLIVF